MKSIKLYNSLTWHCYVTWGLVGLILAAPLLSPTTDFSWKFLPLFLVLLPLDCALMCGHLKNTYEIKDGYLHIHELEYWFVYYDYSIPIKNIDKADLIWRMKLPCHSLRLWVGSAKYTLSTDIHVSELILAEIKKLKDE